MKDARLKKKSTLSISFLWIIESVNCVQGLTFPLWSIPSHSVFSHTGYHMNWQRKHPINKRCFAEVGIRDDTHRMFSHHIIELSSKGTNRRPKIHCLSDSLGSYYKTNRIGISRNQVSQNRKAQDSPLTSQSGCSQEGDNCPMMAMRCCSGLLLWSCHF